MPGWRFFGALLTTGALCAPVAPAAAQSSPAAGLTCRASAAAVTLGPQTLEPLVANGANDPCKSDGATVPSLDAHDALGPKTVDAKSQTAFAVTSLSNEGGPTYNQLAGSQAGIENLDLNLGGGALHITAQGVYSTAGAKCSGPNGTPQFPTYVKLAGLTVNDQAVVGGEEASIPLSSGLTSAFDQLSASPLGGLVTVKTEQVYTTATGVTVEAARIELLSAAGSPVVTVVLGQAKAGLKGDPCKDTAAAATGTATGTGTGAGAAAAAQCGDGVDNDRDGKIDAADAQCHTDGNANNAASYNAAIASEAAQCGDLIDNDGDGKADTADPQCHTDGNASNAASYDAGITSEGAPGAVTGSGSSGNSLGAPRPNGTNASNCARLKTFWSQPINGVSGPQRMTSGPKLQRSQWMTRKVVRGRLVNCNGKAIVGAKVTLFNYVRGNLKLIKTGVKTRAGGTLMMITPNNYTTRRLVFSYRGFINRPKVAARSKLRIIVYRHGRVLR